MCVKQAPGSAISNKHLDISIFNRLLPALPHLKGLVLNGIGEPLLHPDLLSMISVARRRMPRKSWIGFQTNGILLTESFTEQLLDCGLDRLCISVDSLQEQESSITSLTHESDVVASVFSMINMVRKGKTRPDFELGAQVVVMRETLSQLPELIKRLAQEGVDFILVSHLLPYHEDVEHQSLFSHHTREAKTIYRKWQKRAGEDGINLCDLTAKTWIYPKTKIEQRTKELYQQMLQEAREQGVWLDVKELGKLSQDLLDEMEDVFNKSREVAGQYDVDLSLPPLSAASDRFCSFVEDKSVLIDVNGEVTPCHQLWHTKTVHMGETKQIHCKSFGNVLKQDLVDIYQSEPYQQFRRAVRRYDYPFCHSCTLGPCSDIAGENNPFQSDCFGIEVPCGHCLWGFDAIRCL